MKTLNFVKVGDVWMLPGRIHIVLAAASLLVILAGPLVLVLYLLNMALRAIW